MGSNNPNGKIRVYELARDLGMEDSKPLIRILRGMGYPVNTASNSIPDDAVQKVKETVVPHLEQMLREAKGKKGKETANKETKAPEPTPAAPARRMRVVKRGTPPTPEAKPAAPASESVVQTKPAASEPQVVAKAQQPAVEVKKATPAPTVSKESTPKATPPVTPTRAADKAPKPVVAEATATPEPKKTVATEAPIPAQEEKPAPKVEPSAKPAPVPSETKPKPIHPIAKEEEIVSEPPVKSIPASEAFKINKPETVKSTKVEVRISEKVKTQPKHKQPRYRPNDDNLDFDEYDDKFIDDIPNISPEDIGLDEDELDKPVSLTSMSPKQPLVLPKSVKPSITKPITDSKGRIGRPGQQRPGQQRPGQQRPGQNRPGQQRPGQNRPGQQRPGQQRPGQAKKKNTDHVHVEQNRVISIPEVIALSELASRLSKPSNEIIKYLISQGKMVSINQPLSYDEACQIATDFGFEVGDMAQENIPLELIETEEERDLTPRPPVVTVLGHVDHGKTSLLDAIRSTSVTEGEAGGITQKIGAYTVLHTDSNTDEKRLITFIDTPGHEAFTQMRARGASVTDIAVLVVAANDGVMPQTIEAINHAKAAKVPIIVAINKCDLPDANPERVMQQLTEYGLVAEDWGGDTVMVQVSAKKRIGLNDLLDMILLVADMNELTANAKMHAQGSILEGWMNKGMGPVATVLVQSGTLHVGDTVVVGKTWGRVRSLTNEKGKRIPSAGPSIPAEITGLSDVPNAGDFLQAVEDEKMAKQVSAARVAQERNKRLTARTKQTLESLFSDMQNGVAKELSILVKADGHGSMEAINQSLNRLSTDEVAVKIVHSGVGAITESDIMLASASGAMIVGFNVRPDNNVKRVAFQEGVDIRYYQVIYHVMDDIKAVMSGLLTPDIEEQEIGHVEVRQVFKISKAGKVAGCYVTDGKVTRDGLVRLIRDGVVIFTGKIDTLKRFKDDAKEVGEGYECGLTIADYPNVEVGDVIEVYQKVEHKREL